MIEKILVFVSSTSDLREEREAVAREIRGRYEPYLYERDRSRRGTPEQHLIEVLREKTDVFLCILGGNYGSPYSKENEEPSIVEWEFETAAEDGKMEMLTYIKVPQGDPVDPRQQRFIDRVKDFREGTWVTFFSAANELTSSAKDALADWLAEVYIADKRKAERRDLIRQNILLAIASGAVIVTAAGTALAYWSDSRTVHDLLAVYVGCIVTILLCFFVNRLEVGV